MRLLVFEHENMTIFGCFWSFRPASPLLYKLQTLNLLNKITTVQNYFVNLTAKTQKQTIE